MKKLLMAVVLALVTAAALVPVAVFAAPSGGGGSTQAASQAHPWLGVAVAPLTPRVADKLGLAGKTGLLVRHVVADSPAANAGLKRNDLITAANGSPVTRPKELMDAANAAGVGGSLALAVLRNGVELPAITIQLAERPARPALARLPSLHPRGKLNNSSATFEDGDGNVVTISVVAGAVAAKGDGSITIKPNGGGADITVALTGDVKLAKGAREATLDQVDVGAPAVIISKDGQAQRVQVGPFRLFHHLHPRSGASIRGVAPQIRERLEGFPALKGQTREELKKRRDEVRKELQERMKDAQERRQRPSNQSTPTTTGSAQGVDA